MILKSIILLFVVTAASFTGINAKNVDLEIKHPSVWRFPRVDEIYFREEFGYLAKYDAAWDAWRYVHELGDANWNFSLLPNHCTWIFAINCRDVTPESSGKFVNYHGRTPGFSLYPLNLSEFRQALKIIINSVKEGLIREIFGVEFAFPLSSIIPPTNRHWFNPNAVDTSHSVAEAYRILLEAGFSNSSGYWVCPNGEELRQIHLIAPDSPTFIGFSRGIVRQLNNFFGRMSDGKSDYFVVDVPGFPHSAYITYYNRDFDISLTVCWPSVYPSFLYYHFHIDNDYTGGWNVHGFNNSLLDNLLWMINFGRDSTTGRLLSLEELRDACFKAQLIIKEETSVIPLFGRTRIPAFKPKLAGWNFEFDQKWLYTLTHWKDLEVGGHVSWLVQSTNYIEEFVLHPLKPLKRYLQYRYLFDVAFDPLIVFNSYTGQELPWAAIDWNRQPWFNSALNVTYGMKVTFWLRNDMYWHDGVQITAEDVKFCWEYLKRYNAPIFKDVANKLVRVETEGNYIVHAYLNSTSYALIYDLADTALLLPKHLWENVADPLAFKPWKHIHLLFNGSRESWPDWWPYDWPLTMYVGSGPFIFHEWNSTASPQYIHVIRNSRYWVTCPVVSGIAAKPYAFVGDPANFTVALTSVLDENTTVELSIYVDDVLWDAMNISIRPFGYVGFGPYTIEGLSPGIHTIKTEHTEPTTGISFTYTQEIMTTIPEDLNRDLHVDIQDISIAANAFGSYPSHPRWNPQADINKDNYVGIDDIYRIAKKFGWTA